MANYILLDYKLPFTRHSFGFGMQFTELAEPVFCGEFDFDISLRINSHTFSCHKSHRKSIVLCFVDVMQVFFPSIRKTESIRQISWMS